MLTKMLLCCRSTLGQIQTALHQAHHLRPMSPSPDLAQLRALNTSAESAQEAPASSLTHLLTLCRQLPNPWTGPTATAAWAQTATRASALLLCTLCQTACPRACKLRTSCQLRTRWLLALVQSQGVRKPPRGSTNGWWD